MLCCPECLLGARKFAVQQLRFIAEAVEAPAAAPAQGQRWLDVHCHVFNAADLPVAEFIDHTRLSGSGRILAFPALAIIAALYQHAIISASDEAWALKNGQEPPQPAARQAKLAALYALSGLKPAAGPIAAGPSPLPNGLRLIQDALREKTPDRPAAQAPTHDELTQLAALLQGEQDNAPSDYDWLPWIDLLARPRQTIVGKLLEQFPAGADVLLTPSLVDFNRWLGIDSGRDAEVSSLDAQISVMTWIASKRAAPAGGDRRCVVTTFAPFDPWRSIEDDTVLPRLRGWLEQGQAVGVKLYPPMGFAPWSNANPLNFSAPDALASLVLLKRPGMTPGQAIDAELGKLYALCVELDAPVMAHCASSELAEPGNLYLPGPGHWGEVLRQFPTLRLNIGHFGGIWAFAAASQTDDAKRATELAREWAAEIAGLMNQYENVYADIAFFDLALADPIAQDSPSDVALRFLADLVNKPKVAKRLMYGSDWIMVGMLAAANDYARRVTRSMGRIFPDGAAMEDFRWRNAARFLGLGRTGKTRARLVAFMGANAASLDRFDPDT